MSDDNKKSLIEELKEFIIEEEAKDLHIENLDENFQILDDETANFFLKRLYEINQEKEEIVSLCDKEIEKHNQIVNTFREEKLKSFENVESYYKYLLEQYASSKLQGQTKVKSVKLPFGTLQFRKSPSQYTYDNDLLIKYLKDNNLNHLISIVESPNKKEIKKEGSEKDGKLIIDGQEVEGIDIQPGEVKFDVKTNN